MLFFLFAEKRYEKNMNCFIVFDCFVESAVVMAS